MHAVRPTGLVSQKSPAPRTPRVKLPVIGRSGRIAPESEIALRRLLTDGEASANDAEEPVRPRTRAECIDGPRPCPWVSCRHHMFLEVGSSGAILLNHPGLEVDELGDSCSLDVAERVTDPEFGTGASLSTIARHLGISHERVRQIETSAMQGVATVLRKRSVL